MGFKITTETEWIDVQVIEFGPLSFKCSFKEIYSIAALLALCWYANGVGALTEQMQVSQTAYLYHGLKEGVGVGTGYSIYCEPIMLNHGSWETFNKPYIGWDCGRQKTKNPLDVINQTDYGDDYFTIKNLNISGVG